MFEPDVGAHEGVFNRPTVCPELDRYLPIVLFCFVYKEVQSTEIIVVNCLSVYLYTKR